MIQPLLVWLKDRCGYEKCERWSQNPSNLVQRHFSTLNAEKWHLLSKGDRVAQMFSWVHGCTLWDEDSVKLLGILIDSDWSLNKCIKMIFKKASQNHTALLSMANILTKIVNLILFRFSSSILSELLELKNSLMVIVYIETSL